MLWTLLFLVVLLIFALVWLDGMKAKEIATQAAREYAKERGLQLLDGVASMKRMRLNVKGKLRIDRVFQAAFYEKQTEKRFVIPIYMAGLVVIRVGSEDNKVVSMKDYRGDE